MSDIPTWHERAMAHPDHQSGMISEDMIRARMAEEIADLRVEVERLRCALIEWDALIKHQFSGSREAMSDMQVAALNTKRILDGLDAREGLEAKP